MSRARLIALVCLACAAARAGMPPLPVEVAPATRGTVRELLPTVGTVRPLREIKVASQIAERIDKLLVDEGDPVTKGQVVCELDTTNILLRIAEAQAHLNEAKANLTTLEAGSRPFLIVQVEASLAEEKAKTKKLKQDADRAQRLFERGVIADSERDTAVLEYETAVARQQKAEAALALIKEGTRKEEIAEARSTVALRESELEITRQQERDAVIKSPVTGYVVRKHVEEGEWTQIGGTVVDVIDTSVLRVHTRVTETKVRLVQRGQKALVRLDAYPGESLDATVHRVVPKADDTSRSFPVQLDVSDPKGRVRAGMFARVAFILSERAGVLVVPEDALVLRGGMAMVFKAVPLPPPPPSAQGQGPPPGAQGPPLPGPMMMAERVILRTGERQAGNIEVAEVVNGTLEPGDLLVVVGAENMGQGAMMIVVKGLPAPGPQPARGADATH